MRQTSASNTGKSPGFANRAERHISTVREGIYGKLCTAWAHRTGRRCGNRRICGRTRCGHGFCGTAGHNHEIGNSAENAAGHCQAGTQHGRVSRP